LGVGFGLGALTLLMVAFAKVHHQAPAAAWCSAALSAGSALGGLAYGAVSWRTSGGKRLPFLVAVPAVGLAVSGLAPAVWALALAAAIAGTAISPALSTAYLIADETAAPNAKTQAGTWVNTAVNGGVAGGIAGSPVAAAAAIALLLNASMSRRTTQAIDSPDTSSTSSTSGVSAEPAAQEAA
jgi:MFS family permease